MKPEFREVRCSVVFGGPCNSTACSQHGRRNQELLDWSHGRRPAPLPPLSSLAARADFAGEVLPRTGWLGSVPLAPSRARRVPALVGVAVGMAITFAGVLMALGVVHLIHLLHLGGGR